jgi:hypothetical protein
MRGLPSARHIRRTGAAVVLIAAMQPGLPAAEPVQVRHPEGTMRGFLVLRDLDGRLLAQGGATQTVQGDEVTLRIAFNFKDGSLHEQTTVYSQKQRFQVISDRLVQKGPAFPQPLEMTVDAKSGRAVVRYQNEGGETKEEAEAFEMPADLANGIVAKLLMNASPDAMPKSFSLIAATPTPRLVKLNISEAGREPYLVGGSTQRAVHYVLNVEIGGVAGALAPLVGKQPPDSHVWIAPGEAPAFLRAEQPLYAGGPVWRIELASPVWPRTGPNAQANSSTKKRPPA